MSDVALNDKLAGCSFAQEGNDFYIVGADAVRKNWVVVISHYLTLLTLVA